MGDEEKASDVLTSRRVPVLLSLESQYHSSFCFLLHLKHYVQTDENVMLEA